MGQWVYEEARLSDFEIRLIDIAANINDNARVAASTYP